MKKALLQAFVLVAVLYAGLVLCLYIFQRHLIYFPNTTYVRPPPASSIEEVTLVTRDTEHLYSWYSQPDSGKAVVLFMHGNGGSVSTRRVRFEQLQAAGYGVFMVGYPGYGGSEGEPSEATLVTAALLAYEHLIASGFTPRNIVLYGASLGSAVAVQLAATKPARALILEAPMSSVRDIASQQYPFVPVRWLLRDPFLSLDHIANVDEPLLVIHGDRDRVIPFASGRTLFDAANEPKVFHTVAGGGHNNLHQHDIVSTIKKFLIEHGA